MKKARAAAVGATPRRRAKGKTPASPTPPAPFEPDFIFLRTTDAQGRSYGGFQWPIEVGAVVVAPDWNPSPVCGGGLHGLPEGVGDWGLLKAPAEPDALWWVCGALRSEAADIGGKIKVPRCRVLYAGAIAGAIQRIAPAMTSAMLALVKERTAPADAAAIRQTVEQRVADHLEGDHATGDSGAASATGDSGAASATGVSGAASATGYRGAASATGDRGAASATGAAGIAVAAGWGSRGMVEQGSLLVLVERNDEGKIISHLSALVGEHGVEAGKWYVLRGGVPVEEGAPQA